MRKAVFFDRDGVLNEERGTYTYRLEDFRVISDALDVLKKSKSIGYFNIVITNQAGIAKGIYTMEEVEKCHQKLQKAVGSRIDDFYIAPDHPDYSMSLSRKPESLLFEKAIAKYRLDAELCWMIGDKERDLIPAKKLGVKTVLLGGLSSEYADFVVDNLKEAGRVIFSEN